MMVLSSCLAPSLPVQPAVVATVYDAEYLRQRHDAFAIHRERSLFVAAGLYCTPFTSLIAHLRYFRSLSVRSSWVVPQRLLARAMMILA
jgi:hypothetical protein